MTQIDRAQLEENNRPQMLYTSGSKLAEEEIEPVIRRWEMEAMVFLTAAEVGAALRARPYDLLVADCTRTVFTPQELLTAIRTRFPALPILIIAPNLTVAETVRLMRRGAQGIVEAGDAALLAELISDIVAAPAESIEQTNKPEHQTQAAETEQQEFICRYDRDFRIIYVNPTYCAWQEQPADALLGRSVFDFIPAAEHERLRQTLAKMTPENPGASSIHYSLMPDGTLSLVAWSDRAFFDERGEITAYQSVGRDVSDLEKQAQSLLELSQRLENERDQLHQILDTMQEALMSISLPDRQLIFVSSSYADIYGYPVEKFIEDPLFYRQIAHPDDMEAALSAMETCMREGYVQLEHRIMHPDRGVRWVRRRAWAHYDEAGRLLRVIDSGQDITARKLAEEELRFHSQVLQTIAEGVVIVRISDGMIVYANHTFTQLFGYSGDEMHGMHISTLNAPAVEDPQETAARIMGILRDEGSWSGQVHNKRKDGSHFWSLANVVTFAHPEHGEVWIGVHQDITDKKEAERMLLVQNEVLHQSRDLIGLADRNGRIIYINQAGAELLGGSRPEEFIDREFVEFQSMDEYQDVLDEYQPLLQLGETWRGENLLVQLDGSVIEVDQRIFPILDDTGNIIYSATIIADNTERKQTQRVLQEAHELLEQRVIERTAELAQVKNRLEAIFDHSDDGILLLDVEQGVQQANPAFERLFDLPEGGYAGRPLSHLFHPKDTDRLSRTARQVLRTGRTARLDLVIPASRRAVEVSISSIDSDAAAGKNLVCLFRDVSKRKEAEQATAEERDLLRTIIDAVPDLIYMKDRRSRLVLSNAAHNRVLGVAEHEITGKTDSDLFDLDLADRFMVDDRRVIEKGIALQQIDKWVAAGQNGGDDSDIWMLTKKVPLHNLQGECIGLIGIANDISDIMAKEAELRDSDRRFRALTESAPIAIVISDEEGIIQLFNQAAEQMFGYDRQELLGSNIDRLVPDVVRDHHKYLRADYIAGKIDRGPEPMELRAQRQNGEVFPVEIRLSRTRSKSGVLVKSFILDVTQRRKSEQMMQQALAREKELGALKSRFVSMASHQFRTPLAAILATAETLSIYRSRMNEEQIGERLQKIGHQVMHMKGLIDDVLNLSRIQADQVTFNPTAGDLAQVCREVVEEFNGQEAYHGRIQYRRAAAPLNATFDAQLMRQVFTNLIHNALKYSDKPVDVQLRRGDGRIRFSVSDEGIGVPQADRERLFEPFHRARNVGAISGTGLGLSIVQQCVEAHHGRIDVTTQEGHGSRFTVIIPDNETEEKAA